MKTNQQLLYRRNDELPSFIPSFSVSTKCTLLKETNSYSFRNPGRHHPKTRFRPAHMNHSIPIFSQTSTQPLNNTISDESHQKYTFTKSPCIIVPGLGNNTKDYDELAHLLRERGFPVFILEIQRWDWSRNASGFLKGSYWKGTLEPSEVLMWFFNKMDKIMEKVEQEYPSTALNIIGHSAGGWLSRVYFGEFYDGDVSERIKHIVSLGSPQNPPPAGVFDQTRGLLTYCNGKYPALYHGNVRYTCIGGKSVFGKKIALKGSSLSEIAAYSSYQPVCGQGEVWGDGIVPLQAAFLEGATNIEIEGALHSMLLSRDLWYGSKVMIDTWIHVLD